MVADASDNRNSRIRYVARQHLRAFGYRVVRIGEDEFKANRAAMRLAHAVGARCH